MSDNNAEQTHRRAKKTSTQAKPKASAREITAVKNESGAAKKSVRAKSVRSTRVGEQKVVPTSDQHHGISVSGKAVESLRLEPRLRSSRMRHGSVESPYDSIGRVSIYLMETQSEATGEFDLTNNAEESQAIEPVVQAPPTVSPASIAIGQTNVPMASWVNAVVLCIAIAAFLGVGLAIFK